jgi:hypothetical protein
LSPSYQQKIAFQEGHTLPSFSPLCRFCVQFDDFLVGDYGFLSKLREEIGKSPVKPAHSAIALDLSADIACHEGSCRRWANHTASRSGVGGMSNETLGETS